MEEARAARWAGPGSSEEQQRAGRDRVASSMGLSGTERCRVGLDPPVAPLCRAAPQAFESIAACLPGWLHIL